MEFETEKDKIGRKEFVDKIASCVDHLADKQNICIAIDGEWGSGKSFVMEKLYERLNADDNYLVVRYDAWECSFYDEPLFAIFGSILDCAKEKLSLLPGGKKGLKAVGKEIGKDALEELSKKSGKLGNLATFIKGFLKYIGIYKNGATIDTSDERSKEFKSYQSYLKEVQDSLNEYTTHSDYRGKKNKLIVLVDELDRCLPDMQLKILERLHHLFDVKSCAVVCAINAGRVADNMNAAYGVDGYEYLRKFFDLTYRLEMLSNVYLQNLMNDFEQVFNKFVPLSNDIVISIRLACQCLVGCKKEKRVDNRELSRYYDNLVNLCTQFGWERIRPHFLFFIIIGLYIRMNIRVDFLSPKAIAANQNFINPTNIFKNDLIGDADANMPYFDYIFNYLGFDRRQTFKLCDLDGNARDCFLAIPSWCFNEIVYYSTQARFPYNEMRRFYSQPTVDPAICKELCDLIRLYGGDKCVR